jgi:nucleoside-diphosphate-sugar epimerase
MKSAIVSGANGYLGKALTKKLLERNVRVFAIIRSDSFDVIDANIISIKGDLNDIEPILDKLENFSDSFGSVFYHTAWRGSQKLMDGDLEDQLVNVVNSVNALKIAKHIKCSKFINVGSQEEMFFERHLDALNGEALTGKDLNLNYGTAKLAARDMCRLTSHLEKVNYIHTRLSVITDPSSDKGYINKTMNKIKYGQPYEKPQSSQLYDFTDIDNVANAYIELGEKGQNRRNYYIGSGKPRFLYEYFKMFEDYIKTGKLCSIDSENSSEVFFEEFNNQLIFQDTGVQLNDFKDYMRKYKK